MLFLLKIISFIVFELIINKIYVVKNHHAPLYPGDIPVKVKNIFLKLPGYPGFFNMNVPINITNIKNIIQYFI